MANVSSSDSPRRRVIPTSAPVWAISRRRASPFIGPPGSVVLRPIVIGRIVIGRVLIGEASSTAPWRLAFMASR